MSELIPPDLERCQAYKPNGHSFMTLGGKPGLIRCGNRPEVIITESSFGEDGKQGSMTLCGDCLHVFNTQSGTPAMTVETIQRKGETS